MHKEGVLHDVKEEEKQEDNVQGEAVQEKGM